MKKIIVKLGDYAISDVEGLPEGTELEIHNYDLPDNGDDMEDVEVDDNGDNFERIVWRG